MFLNFVLEPVYENNYVICLALAFVFAISRGVRKLMGENLKLVFA